MANYPNSDIVAITWLKHVLGLPNSVAGTLPSDNTTWSASGFVQPMVVGGGMNKTGMRRAMVQCSCWATTPTSGKPPWGKAANLAELIRNATLNQLDRVPILTLPSPYMPVRIHTVNADMEPRKITNDPASYA